jgi:Domain of unknown function (DUF4832)
MRVLAVACVCLLGCDVMVDELDGGGDAAAVIRDAGAVHDGGPEVADSGVEGLDAGSLDSGTVDAGAHDGGIHDAGQADAGRIDAGQVDSGTVVPDAGFVATVLFSPPALPKSGPELLNPMRGQYLWHDNPTVPSGWPVMDSYYRWNWIDIETSRGVYNWAPIDQRVAAARARHGRFGLRIMALCQDCSSHVYRGARSAIPDDLADVANPLLVRPDGSTETYLIPDWNSAAYLSRLEELMTAIANRYRNNPNFGWVDVSGYGNWGEMHLWPFDPAYANSTQRPLTVASAQRMVQIHATAFSNKFIFTNVSHAGVLAAAMANTTPRIGLRVDCLGSDRLGGAETGLAAVPAATQQWRYAAFTTEWCASNIGSSGLDPFIQGETQVRQYHVSTLGTNFRAAPSTAAQSDAYRMADVGSGYRLRTSSVRVTLTADRLAIRTSWANDNVAPTYLNWRVVVRLDGPRTVEVPLAFDLRTVMPGALDDDETLSLPVSLVHGTYTVSLRVEDVQSVSPPMQLAMPGRDVSGNHVLGTLTL